MTDIAEAHKTTSTSALASIHPDLRKCRLYALELAMVIAGRSRNTDIQIILNSASDLEHDLMDWIYRE